MTLGGGPFRILRKYANKGYSITNGTSTYHVHVDDLRPCLLPDSKGWNLEKDFKREVAAKLGLPTHTFDLQTDFLNMENLVSKVIKNECAGEFWLVPVLPCMQWFPKLESWGGSRYVDLPTVGSPVIVDKLDNSIGRFPFPIRVYHFSDHST